MRGEDDRPSAEAAHELTELDRLDGIEADRRLVEHQHVGIAEQRLRQADTLAVALRQVSRRPLRDVREPARGDHSSTAARRFAPARPFMPATKRQVPADGQLGVEHHLLRQVPDPAARLDWSLRDVHAAHAHAAARGVKNPIRHLRSVLFPEPFGPRSASTSPRGSSNDTSSTARIAP